jgi:hypothetical protein
MDGLEVPMATRRVGDSDEEEATSIDLGARSKSASKSVASSPALAKRPVAPRPPAIADDDEDATEFLSRRPPSQAQSRPLPAPEPALRARGRAVPISTAEIPTPTAAATDLSTSSASAVPTSPSSAPSSSSSSGRPARESTEPLVTLKEPARAPRPLPDATGSTTAAQRQHPPIDDVSTTGSHPTASVPRITRIVGTPDDTESTMPPGGTDAKRVAQAAQQVQATLQRERERERERDARARSATITHNLNDETQAPDSDSTQAPHSSPDAPREDAVVEAAHDGVLVVEAPVDAVVVVNGVERGKGVVRVSDLDRNAKHAVRIHAPGHQPWSGSVTLEGKSAAKIRPTLKPRPR